MSKYFPMTILEFSLDLPAQPKQLMKLTEDYENLPKYLPDQLKSVKIIEKNETVTKTEETVVFRTLIKKVIIQNFAKDAVKERVVEFRKNYQKVQYCFDNKLGAYEYVKLR